MHQPGKVDKETHERTRHNAKVLAKATSISEAKISRIMRDSTEPGDSFEWTEPDINNISIVLQWGTQGDINYEARGSPHIVLQESSRF